MTLGKHVLVLLEESYECSKNCWADESADPYGSIQSRAVEGYLLEPFYEFSPHSLFFYAHGL